MPISNPSPPATGLIPLGSILLTAPAASMEFTGIPAGYAAFLLIWDSVYGDDAATQVLYLTFNSDGGGNYDFSIVQFNIATTPINASTFIEIGHFGDTDGNQERDSGKLFITNRATTQKICHGSSVRAYYAGANIEDQLGYHIEGKWRNVADEIDTITLTPSVGNFVAGSRVILMGVLAA